MATRKNEPPTEPSSKNALVILTAGCLLVAGLVVWALTRTVEPAAPAPVAPVADQTATPATTAPPPPPFNPTDTAINTITTPGSPVQVQFNGGQPQTVPVNNAPQMPSTTGRSEDQVKRIAAEDVRDKINSGSAVVVDVRDAAAFAKEHIPGSINIPFSSVQTQMSQLPKDKEIITLCT
jgi:Rhodanese-like domain